MLDNKGWTSSKKFFTKNNLKDTVSTTKYLYSIYHGVCPLVGIGIPPTPLPQASVPTSNGNDIEAKRYDTKILGVFSLSKRNEPTYYTTESEVKRSEDFIIILCRIEEITNMISPEFAGSKRKRTYLV